MDKKEYIERGLAVQLLRECTQMQGKEIEKECDMPILRNVLNVYYLAREGATTLLEDIPAADVVEVVHGEWKQTEESLGWHEVSCAECSACKETWTLGELELDDFVVFWRYCPNCGAKMDGGKHETD